MTLNLAFWLSLALAGLGCTGLVLAGRGMWQGWALGLAAQPVWAAFAIVSHGYGLLLTCGMYGSVYARNLAKWRRGVATAQSTAPAPWSDAWADGYEWALAHLDDEGVDNDRRRLTGAS